MSGRSGPAAAPIRILIVDDHEMLAASLVRLLHDDPAIEVVGLETTAADGIRQSLQLRPDIVIMDYQLPDMDGATATRRVLQQLPGTKVITLTGTDRRGAYFAAARAGSSAWVRKTGVLDELRAAIHAVFEGGAVPDHELDALPRVEELRVRYQPIVDLRDGHILGFEALVRWEHPTRGLLLPDQFLPRAEETGMLPEIDRWVRRQSAEQLGRWQPRHMADRRLWMSVNMSATDLSRPGLDTEVAADIAGIDPADFVLEVTETALVADDTDTLAQLNRIKATGVGLALDDFGTAFASLSYLRRFPFDHLKIDTSFTAELPGSARTLLLVESIQRMSAAFDLLGIAEGIERPEQADALRGAGWELGQGFLYSRPVDASSCAALLTEDGWCA